MGLIDHLKRAEQAKKENEKHQIPLDMVDADNIPQETPLKYEFLCQLVGSLYIQSHLTLESAQKRYDAVIIELKAKIVELMEQNRQLQEELNRDVSRTTEVSS